MHHVYPMLHLLHSQEAFRQSISLDSHSNSKRHVEAHHETNVMSSFTEINNQSKSIPEKVAGLTNAHTAIRNSAA